MPQAMIMDGKERKKKMSLISMAPYLVILIEDFGYCVHWNGKQFKDNKGQDKHRIITRTKHISWSGKRIKDETKDKDDDDKVVTFCQGFFNLVCFKWEK